MSEFVEKWVAGFDYQKNVIIEAGWFRKTAKLFIREDDRENHQAVAQALGYHSRFDHDSKFLHDSRGAALAWLQGQQEARIGKAQKKIDAARDNIISIIEKKEEGVWDE